jgi:hypothetical protein
MARAGKRCYRPDPGGLTACARRFGACSLKLLLNFELGGLELLLLAVPIRLGEGEGIRQVPYVTDRSVRKQHFDNVKSNPDGRMVEQL